jgi:hypothetical protein
VGETVPSTRLLCPDDFISLRGTLRIASLHRGQNFTSGCGPRTLAIYLTFFACLFGPLMSSFTSDQTDFWRFFPGRGIEAFGLTLKTFLMNSSSGSGM